MEPWLGARQEQLIELRFRFWSMANNLPIDITWMNLCNTIQNMEYAKREIPPGRTRCVSIMNTLLQYLKRYPRGFKSVGDVVQHFAALVIQLRCIEGFKGSALGLHYILGEWKIKERYYS